MQFKHPEILYALFLLVIPIIIHLFQLQKFKKVPFTNVQFLKKIEQETRKSSRLKKLLILLTRLLAFTCLIIAFAQPFLAEHSIDQNYHTTLYLDNSFSMQAKGSQGELLKSSAQQIIENISDKNNSFTLITNDNEFKNIDVTTLKNELKKVQYSSNKLDLNTLLLKIESYNNNKTKTSNKNILITDFQLINFNKNNEFTNVNSPFQLVKVAPIKNNNVYIDSIYFSNDSQTELTLHVVAKSNLNTTASTPISLYNDTVLIGKSMVKFENSSEATTEFTLSNTSDFKGELILNNNDLSFDDSYYFYLSKPEKPNILIVGESSDFLRKIYTENEFNLAAFNLQNLDYNSIQKQHLIVLNDLEKISTELTNELKEYVNLGGNLVVIPSEKSDILTYNTFLKSIEAGNISEKIDMEQKITSINYDHSLLLNVFEKQVFNFEYPNAKTYFKGSFFNAEPILKFASNNAFISSTKLGEGTFYWIASPLNTEHSNFTQSSLVVPIFYNFGMHSLKIPQPFYSIQPETTIELAQHLQKDAILSIASKDTEFIPLQQIQQNKVSLSIVNNNLQSGFYTIKKGEIPIKTIAFNYNRAESVLQYSAIEKVTNQNKYISISNSIPQLFDEIYQEQKINWLFKWFLAFSVLFLLIEMLLLKYFNI